MAFSNRRSFPCHMNLIKLTFLPMSVEETFYDEVFRQPVRTKTYLKEESLMGQVNFGRANKIFFNRLNQSLSLSWPTPGDLVDTFGHLVISKEELDKSDYFPKKGDLFIGYKGYSPPEGIEFLIEEVRPESPLYGEVRLYYFELRSNRNKR